MTNPQITRGTLLASVLSTTLLVGACGGGDDSSATKKKLGAAEPATSPALTDDPAGSVVKVAPAPQGIIYDAKTDLLAVNVHDPYRLLLLDPTTMAIKGSADIPGKARHLQLAKPGGPVLVPAETADALVEVSLPSAATRTTKVLRHPHDASGAPNGDVVVIDEFTGAFTVVRDGKVIKNVRDLKQPGGVHVVGDTIVVVDVGEFTVSTYDLTTYMRLGRLNAGEGPTHGVPSGDNRFVAGDTRGNHLILYSINPLKKLHTLDRPGTPYGMAADETTHTVWVTLTETNKLLGYDYSTDTPKQIAEYDTVQQPDTVAVDAGSKTLWVTGTKAGVIQRITR